MVHKISIQDVWQARISKFSYCLHTTCSCATRDKNNWTKCSARTCALRCCNQHEHESCIGFEYFERRFSLLVLQISWASKTSLSSRAFVESRKVCFFRRICADRSCKELCEKSRHPSRLSSWKPHSASADLTPQRQTFRVRRMSYKEYLNIYMLNFSSF